MKTLSSSSSRGCAGTVPPVKDHSQLLGDTGGENSSGRGGAGAEAAPGCGCVTATWDTRLAKRQQFRAGLPRLWLNIVQTVIHPSQVGSDPFLRSGQMNFTLKVTEKLFWAAESPFLIAVLCQGAAAAQQRQLKEVWPHRGIWEKLGLFCFHRVPP